MRLKIEGELNYVSQQYEWLKSQIKTILTEAKDNGNNEILRQPSEQFI